MKQKHLERLSIEERMRAETVRAFGVVLNVIDPGSRQEASCEALLAEIAWHHENAKNGATYSRMEKRFLALIEQAMKR